MKKFLVTSIVLFLLALGIPFAGVSEVQAQRYRKSYNSKKVKRYRSKQNCRTPRRSYRRNNARNSRYYRSRGYSSSRRPSVYRRHRNLINIGIGTGAGAIVGGILGGKKGALIGAGVGAGAGAAYTYGIRPKKRRYRNR